MSELDPQHVEAVARAFCPKAHKPCDSCRETAVRILLRPDALVTALVQAGVIEETDDD